MHDLTFGTNGRLKLLYLTDIHYFDHGEKDLKTLSLIEDLIRWESPDLIVIGGDTFYGPDNLSQIEPALRPIVDSGIPWTITFGNHDQEDGASNEALFEQIRRLPGCLAYDGAPGISGTANHDLRIRDDDGKLIWLISLLDSGDYMSLDPTKPDAKDFYDMVKLDQIVWQHKRLKELENENPVYGALLFIHIPLPEHDLVWQQSVCYGEKNERVCAAPINSGLYAAMRDAGHVRAILSGHDHTNDYIGDYHGILLGYGRQVGYNTYGRDGFLRGARIISLDQADSETFQTWIRLSDGSVIPGDARRHEPTS